MKTVSTCKVMRLVSAANSIATANPWERPEEFGRLCAKLQIATIMLETELERGELQLDDHRPELLHFPTTKSAVPF